MKFSLFLLSAVAACASAASLGEQVSPENQPLYNSFTSSEFPYSPVDIEFRFQSDKDAYFKSLNVYNQLIRPHEFPSHALPLAIVKPTKGNNTNIAAVVKVAEALGLRVSARSGGYMSGYSANMAAVDKASQDFLLVDLSKLQGIKISADKKIAEAEPGVTGALLAAETSKYGLMFAGPHTSRVTIGGFLLQGGMGVGSRLHGAGVDNVIGFDIVTATGKVLYVDRKRNKELFFAVRGGGQFFGIVTKFYLRLAPIAAKPSLEPAYNASTIPIDQVFTIFDRPQAMDLMNYYAKFDYSAPKALENKIIFVVDAATGNKQYLFASQSAAPFNTSTAVTQAHAGMTEWYKTLPTVFASSEPNTYSGVVHGGDDSWPDNDDLAYYAEDVWFKAPLDPRVTETLVKQWDKVPSSMSSMALNTGTWDAPTKSALGFDRSYSLCIYSTWLRKGDAEEDKKNKKWLEETIAAIKPYTLGFYANELRPRQLGEKKYWERCYEKKTYKTLKCTKEKWDPENMFKSL
ncbi:hypothetical protein DFQ26_004444 [Actinomortierella ambigua]|nr:hypothetical protein DFQ26_004444 [Actinomortierella ambigua]